MFEFINDSKFKKMLVRDKKELDKCYQNELYKSTIVLSGSIIEALLVDFLIMYENREENIEKLYKKTLYDLIEIAKENNLISEKTEKLSHVVRNYRNLIHSGREYRLKEKVDEEHANVAYNLLGIIITELSEKYEKNYKESCEDVLQKIDKDRYSIAIMEDIIENLLPNEKVEIFKSIPSYFYSLDYDPLEFGEIYNNTRERYKIFYNNLADYVDKNIKREEAEKLLSIVRNEDFTEVEKYAYFYIDFIKLLSDKEVKQIIKYFLGVMKKSKYIQRLKKLPLQKINDFHEIYDYTTDIITIIDNHLNYKHNQKNFDRFGDIINTLIEPLEEDNKRRIESFLEKSEKTEKQYLLDRLNL